jgi:hypothetical protein
MRGRKADTYEAGRQEFLRGLGRWSTVVISAVAVGAPRHAGAATGWLHSRGGWARPVVDGSMRASPEQRVVYDIPLEALPAYRGRRVIVRARSPAAVVLACGGVPDAGIVCVQLDDLPTNVDPLADWGHGLPIQVTMGDPAVEFPALYRYARLVETHPVRVVMPVRRGFSRGVKLATSLEMAVKLDVGQPSPAQVAELAAVLDFYLHGPSCSQPIDFFHGTLRALYHREASTLWDIQDEDPARVRRIDDDGTQTVGRADAPAAGQEPLPAFVPRLQNALIADGIECGRCEFWKTCGGYFKWPRREYDCGGVKALFGVLVDAASELRADVARYRAGRQGAAP